MSPEEARSLKTGDLVRVVRIAEEDRDYPNLLSKEGKLLSVRYSTTGTKVVVYVNEEDIFFLPEEIELTFTI